MKFQAAVILTLVFGWLDGLMPSGAASIRPSSIGSADFSTATPNHGPQYGRVPNGLTVVDWNQIRAEYDRHRHSAFPNGDGYEARSREQQWRVRFDARGFEIQPDHNEWRWGLELIEYAGRPVAGKARVVTQKNRVGYQWNADIEEWFVNRSQGLEHGFTISGADFRQSSSQSGTVDLVLAVRGGLHPQGSGAELRFVNASGEVAVNYSGLKAWDADGRALPSHMEAAEDTVRLTVQDRGARYPITIDPVAQQAYLKPVTVGSVQASDYFGFSVAISGGTVVVGAVLEDSSSTGVNSTPNESALSAGAAYVFVRSGATWTQQAYLKPASVGITQAGDQFGYAVAISGDTIIVGANAEDSSTLGIDSTPNEKGYDDTDGYQSGAAYVFVRSGTTWTQQAYLKPANVGSSQSYDQFGSSVAVSGDTVVVGSVQESSSSTGINSTPNESAPNAGAAHVFVRTGITWAHQAYIKPGSVGTTQANDYFGGSVSLSGDTLVVGASQESSSSTGVNSTPDESASGAGAAFVFVRSGNTWTQQAFLKPASVGTSQAGDSFGVSVAVSGDTLVVGAYQERSSTTGVNSTPNESASNAGAAYVFVRSGVNWTQQAYLKPASVGVSQNNDFFGHSVGVAGDTVVVGAPGERSSSTGINGTPDELAFGAGAAYVYTRSGATWTQQAYLKPLSVGTSQVEDGFGRSVAVSGDTVVAGARLEDSSTIGSGSTPNESALNAGAVYVFTIPPSNTAPVITPAGVTRQQGLSGSALIATVSDTQDSAGSLAVTVQSANPSNGVTLSLISNSAGNVTADVAAAAGASNASFTLRVTDSGGAFTDGTLSVTVTQPVSISRNVNPAANGNGWHKGPVTITWTVTNADSQTGCGTAVLSAETPLAGNTITCSASNAGGSATQSATVKIDLTPPIAAGARTPAPNANGWNNTDVTANFACADVLSGVVAPTSSQTVTSQAAGQTRSFACEDLAGNTTSATVSGINIDKTAPTGTASSTPPANANGWNNTDVTANFACADVLSGPVSVGSSQIISTEGTGQSRAFLCSDLAGNSLTTLVTGVNIDKTNPVVTPASVSATPNPVMVNTAISLSAALTDTGSSNLAQARYRIDSGAYVPFGSPSGASANVIGVIGSFPAPSVVNVCVLATDLAGNQSPEGCTLIAVYDPNGAFVSGAGSFQSPLGALTGSTATGRAQFGFQSKYLPGAGVPAGNTQFKFKAGDFEFNSTAYEWLVVAGARAQFKGEGVVKNQTGTFNFMLTAIDGDLPGGGGQDKFRLKISGPGGVVYDNQMGGTDNSEPSTVIDGGNIVVHK